MANPFKRGTAPDRARPADERPGSFKPGHKKLGGRKRGTPNVFSLDYKMAILEAAYRIGEDANGKNGVVGYLTWVSERDPRIFFRLFMNIAVSAAKAGRDQLDEPRPTTEDNGPSTRDVIGLTAKNPTKGRPVEIEPDSPWAWTGQPFPVGNLMHLAIVKPKAFCQLLVAAFVPRPTKRRRPAAPPDESRPQDGNSQGKLTDRKMFVHSIRRPYVRRARTLSKTGSATVSSKSRFLRTTLPQYS